MRDQQFRKGCETDRPCFLDDQRSLRFLRLDILKCILSVCLCWSSQVCQVFLAKRSPTNYSKRPEVSLDGHLAHHMAIDARPATNQASLRLPNVVCSKSIKIPSSNKSKKFWFLKITSTEILYTWNKLVLNEILRLAHNRNHRRSWGISKQMKPLFRCRFDQENSILM